MPLRGESKACDVWMRHKSHFERKICPDSAGLSDPHFTQTHWENCVCCWGKLPANELSCDVLTDTDPVRKIICEVVPTIWTASEFSCDKIWGVNSVFQEFKSKSWAQSGKTIFGRLRSWWESEKPIVSSSEHPVKRVCWGSYESDFSNRPDRVYEFLPWAPKCALGHSIPRCLQNWL